MGWGLKREFESKYNEVISQSVHFLFFRDSAKNEEVEQRAQQKRMTQQVSCRWSDFFTFSRNIFKLDLFAQNYSESVFIGFRKPEGQHFRFLGNHVPSLFCHW